MTFQCRGIPAPLVEQFWHYAEPYIKRALDHTSGEFDPDYFKRRCLSRDIQLWLVSKESRIYGAATTEVVIYPYRKHCRVITISGSHFDEWMPAMDELLCTWAQAQGCDAMESYVRRGFVPKLATIGYKHKYSAVVKELKNVEGRRVNEHSTEK